MNKELYHSPIINLFWQLLYYRAADGFKGVFREEYSAKNYKTLFQEFKKQLENPENAQFFQDFHEVLKNDISLVEPQFIGNTTCLQEMVHYYPKTFLKDFLEKYGKADSESTRKDFLKILLSNFNYYIGVQDYSVEKSCANLASFYLSIIVREKEFDAIRDLEDWLFDEKFKIKIDFTEENKHIYLDTLKCFWYLKKNEKCTAVHKQLYALEDLINKYHDRIYEAEEPTVLPPLEEHYHKLTSKLKTNWTFSSLVQASNAYRLNLITVDKYKKVEKRLKVKEQEQREIEKEFKEFVAEGNFLNLTVDNYCDYTRQELVEVFKLEPFKGEVYKTAFGPETTFQLTQDQSLFRLERLLLEFFHTPSKKEEILNEIEYLKIINPPWYKPRTGDLENLIKIFSGFEEKYIQEWFRIVAKIEYSKGEEVQSKVFIWYEDELFQVWKGGLTQNIYSLLELRSLPLNILSTAIGNGNYEPTKEEIEFHLWGNEGSQHITNEVLEKLTGNRSIRRLPLVGKANLEQLSIVLHQVFLEIEKYFEENVKEREKAFLDHELFLKLLKATVKTKKVDQAKYWFEWYEKIKNKHRISGSELWSGKIGEEYNKLDELLQELDVCSFQEARAFAQSLNLNNKKEWQEFCAGTEKPKNIPPKPEQIYKDNGWTDYTDFLGLSNSRKFKDFADARDFARGLGLKSEQDWRDYKSSGSKPDDIPAKPENVYKEEGWCGFKDWLGYEKVQRKNNFKDFVEAKEFILSLELKGEVEWEEYKKTGLKPKDIPADPEKVYKDKGWCGFQDWLEFTVTDSNKQEFATAKELIVRLAPAKAREYEKEGWPEFKNPRATGEQGSQFRDFILARDFVRTLNLKSAAEWRDYNRSGKRPADIPAKPDRVYKSQGWVSFPDWMGYKDPGNTSFKSFKEAQEFVRSLGLMSENDWREYKKSGSKPDDIPAKPEKVYKAQGWCGFMDWLGYTTVQRNQPSGVSQFMNFEQAREFARSLNLRTEEDWRAYKRTGKRPPDIPAKPENVYKGKGWKGYGDWLRTG